MKIIKLNNLATNFAIKKKPLVAIWGFFDGWHIGHQALLKKMQTIAKKYHYQTLVVSFDQKPQSFLLKQEMPILLNHHDRLQFLIKQQINYYCELTFNQEIANSSAQTFINWLISNNVVAVVTSKNIHFGRKAEGNLTILQNSPLKVFLSQDIFDQQQQKVSSTYIKNLLVNKNIVRANQLLNHESYTIAGHVVDGIKEGRKLGFPTANLALTDNYVLPGVGVYITKTKVDGRWYSSMTVVLLRNQKPLVESYLLNFNQNIYGKLIKVRFLDYLRDHLTFTNQTALINQINDDLAKTIAYFKNVA